MHIQRHIGSVTYVLIHTARGGKPSNREVRKNPREQGTEAPGKPTKKKKKKENANENSSPTRMSAGGRGREARAQGCDVKRVCSTLRMKMYRAMVRSAELDSAVGGGTQVEAQRRDCKGDGRRRARVRQSSTTT